MNRELNKLMTDTYFIDYDRSPFDGLLIMIIILLMTTMMIKTTL